MVNPFIFWEKSTIDYDFMGYYNVLMRTDYMEKIVHLSVLKNRQPAELPEFREYARQKYPDSLDDDLITMIEDLIERGRSLCTLKQVRDGISTNRKILLVV
ncbi:hypothetical protein ACFLWG_03590 [Chloroflexota bacterium]